MNIRKLPDIQDAQASLPPEEYQDLLKGVELVDVLVDTVAAELKRDLISGQGELSAKIEVAPRAVNQQQGLVDLLMECRLDGLVNDESAVKIRAVYRLRLACRQPLSVEFLVIYAQTSGGVQIWPFFREIVHSMSTRMGIPQLTLPVRLHGVSRSKSTARGTLTARKSPVDKEAGEAQ